MSIMIDPGICTACGACREVCPGTLIKRDPSGKAFLKHPEECWGCASCLKECRFGAIQYFLGADIGGQGSFMQTEREGHWIHWEITRPDGDHIRITVDQRQSNQY